MSFRLLCNGIEYSAVTLSATIPVDVPVDLTPNQRAAFDFCRLWLSDTETITLHTSGSTGTPKPIDLRRAQMVASARATLNALDIAPGERALLCLNARYVAGCMMLVRALVGELQIEVVEPASNPLTNNIAPFVFTALVPLQLEAILDAGGHSLELLNGARAVLIGGAALSPRLEDRAQAVGAPLYHTYGMTETVSHIALRPINGAARSDFFTPLPGVELALDARGALRIRAPMSNNEWVQTNDVVDINGDGTFRWLGRIDNVINSGGIKVQVETVEAALEEILEGWFENGLPGYFVTAIDDDRLGQRVALVLEAPPLDEVDEQRLLTRAREQLGAYQAPRSILYASRFVQTPTGKIDRNASRAIALAS